MTKKYDVIIVGAGPGGAMAAKTAGENGLKTALIERKSDPALITRGCAMMFAVESDYYFAERMFYNDCSRKMVFPVNGLTVDYSGPVRNFYSWKFIAPDAETSVEFGDYEKNIALKNKGRLSFTYDKGSLLEGLINNSVKNRVDLFTGINAKGVEKTSDGVRVITDREVFHAPFVIAADGINSRIAQSAGFNRNRPLMGRPASLTCYLTGFKNPQAEAAISACYTKPASLTPSSFFMVPSAGGSDEYWMSVRSMEDFRYITEKTPYSKWFSNVKIKKTLSYVLSLRAPVPEPFKDNIMLVGDSAWFAEAEITGSMMCGHRAANAVTLAFRDNLLNRNGVSSYIEWWNKSYKLFDDYRNFALLPVFIGRTFTEKELIYLFGLIKEPLRSTLNPFLIVRLIKDALKPVMSRIKTEMPSVAEKIEMLKIDNYEKLVSGKK